MKHTIDKAKEIASELPKKIKMVSRRSKIAIKKDVDEYFENLNKHIKRGERRVINSGDKVPSSTGGKFTMSKEPHNAKYGAKL